MAPHLNRILSFALVSLLAACSSTSPFEAPRMQLETAVQQLESSQYSEARDTLETLIGETQEDPGFFALQRFYAFYLAAQVHLEASLTEPFLDTGNNRSSSFTSSSDFSAAAEHPEAHILACLFSVANAESHAEAARSMPAVADDIALLPESLTLLSPTGDSNEAINVACDNMVLAQNTCYARLEFDRQVKRFLQRQKALVGDAPEVASNELDRLYVPREQRPWVNYMIFDYLRDDPEQIEFTYMYAVEALEGEDVYGYELPKQYRDRIVHWVTVDSGVQFECPETGEPFDPNRKTSSIGRHRKAFVANERPQG